MRLHVRVNSEKVFIVLAPDNATKEEVNRAFPVSIALPILSLSNTLFNPAAQPEIKGAIYLCSIALDPVVIDFEPPV